MKLNQLLTPAGVKPATQRFYGVDIFRILSAYGVVVLHSGLGRDFHVDRAAASYQHLFNFPVPTFLALSFFLQVYRKPGVPFNIFARWRRLMIPYFVWTVIHLAARAAKYVALHQSAKINELISDPLGLLFFGAASAQLYFLPLLFVGSCLCAYLQRPLLKAAPSLLILLLVLTTFSYHVIVVTGNGFDLSTGWAFQNLVAPHTAHRALNQSARVVLVYLFWLIRCLPYVIGVCLWARFGANRPFDGALVSLPLDHPIFHRHSNSPAGGSKRSCSWTWRTRSCPGHFLPSPSQPPGN